MALADTLNQLTIRPVQPCVIGQLAAKLGVQDRETLLNALANPTIQTSVIADALATEGHPVGRTSLTRHRRGQCNCSKAGA